MIKVLVVEDSAVAREFLVETLNRDPGIRVVGTARDGLEAIQAAEAYRPDVITMDINMPRLGGLEATQRIMETNPTRIVMVTGNDITEEVASTFKSLDSGALAILPRPGAEQDGAAARTLLETVKLMSEVPVVRRLVRRPMSAGRAAADADGLLANRTVEVVAMGASTGGPHVLKTILSGLSTDFTLPILLVQHIAAGFVKGFADWLREATGRDVKVAQAGELIVGGRVYVAPDGAHMGMDGHRRIVLTQAEAAAGICPSVNHLFRSVVRVVRDRAVGVLLTGMGRDGAEALKVMKEQGALTLAQDKETSIVHSMPGEAIKLGAVDVVLGPDGIAAVLNRVGVPRV